MEIESDFLVCGLLVTVLTVLTEKTENSNRNGEKDFTKLSL